MNKLFVFLYANSIILNSHADSSQEGPSRGINFESWGNLAQSNDEQEERERSTDNQIEEEEEENE